MVKLTADLVFSSPHYFNAVKDRELDLRGNKIPAIENLGATEDHFDSLDMSDNEIVKLEGFPVLKRVTTLLLNNNRITRISTSVGAQLPNLRTLVLSNNRLTNLSDLDPLSYMRKLEALALLDNVVTKKPRYRLYVINLLPNLRLLDFRKVKQKERTEARKVFRRGDSKKSTGKTFVPGEALDGPTPTGEASQAAAAAENGGKEGESEGDKAMEEVGKEGEGKGKEGEGEAKEGKEGDEGGKDAGGDTSMASAEGEEIAKTGPTPEQLTAIKAAIATAATLDEVARLEKALKSGQVPSGF